ncbi:hypothetical protein [Blautia producta]|uniref:hypothetical protein n=1 Tax=Blautia producta TaxID=33035 RepID=UPI001FAA2B67|nr:hypothetical protein [Blautia producta]
MAFSGLSESEKAANAEALVGKNAMSGFLALMNATSRISKNSAVPLKTVMVLLRAWRKPCRTT